MFSYSIKCPFYAGGEIFSTYIITSHSSNYFDKKMIDRMINCILNSKNKRFHPYKYPRPPFAQGYIYIDSIEEEPIGLIVENNN